MTPSRPNAVGGLILAFLACACLARFDSARADDIHLKDGRVIGGVDEIRDMDDIFLYRSHGRNRTINKNKIDKIVTANGEVVFQSQTLTVEKRRLPSNVTQYVFFRNQRRVGSGHWDEDGEFEIEDGDVPDGVYKQYYDSGELEREFTFKDGELNGPCRTFFKSGKVEREGFLKDGREDGISKFFYKSGALKGESVYVDGEKNGETKLYYESGSLKALMNFKNGKPSGEQKMFYDSGELETVIKFEDGEREGPVRHFYESGKLKMKGAFEDGKLEGEVITYYESGRVKKKAFFREGRILRE